MKPKLTFLFLLFFGLMFSGPNSYAQTTDDSQEEREPIILNEQPPEPLITPDRADPPQSQAEEPEPAASADDGSVEEELSEEVSQLRNLISFPKIFLSLFILIGTWFINGLIIRILDNFSERSTAYRLFFKRLTPVMRITIWSFSIYIVLAGIIEPPIETVIAITASLGIAVGFASQDILRNIFGGIMIILDRPFQVGDKIQVGEHYGEVKSIGIRSCLIETPDDNTVAIPNGELMNRAVSNANSSALDCQVVSEIFIPATSDVILAKDIARRAVFSSPYLYLNKPVVVIALNEIHNRHFMIKLRVKAYVLDIRYEFLFKSDVTEMIVTELNAHGIIPRHTEMENQRV